MRKLGGNTYGAMAAVILLLASWAVVVSSPRAESLARLADGAAWLTSTGVGRISLHDGGNAAVVTTLLIASAGDDFEAEPVGSDVLVVNHTTGGVSLVEGATWRPLDSSVSLAAPGDPLDVVVGDTVSWFVRSGAVGVLDVDTLSISEPQSAGDSFSRGMVADDGSLLYSSTDPEAPVRRFFANGTNGTTVDGIDGEMLFVSLDDGTVAIDVDDRSVWMDGRGVICNKLDLPTEGTIVAAGHGNELMVVSSSGSVFMWDPTVDGCPSGEGSFTTTEVTGDFGEPVVADGWAAIPDFNEANVILIDTDVGRRIGIAPLPNIAPGARFDLVGENDSVWFNDPATAAAGLVRRDGSVLMTPKYRQGGDGIDSQAGAAPFRSEDEVPPNEIAATTTSTTIAPTTTEQAVTTSTPPTTEANNGGGESGGAELPQKTTTTLSKPGSTSEPVSPIDVTTGSGSGTGTDPLGPDLTTSSVPASITTTTSGPGPTEVTGSPDTTPTTTGVTSTTADVTSTTIDPTSSSSTSTTPSTTTQPPPIVRIGASAQQPVVGQKVTFLAQIQAGRAVTYDWNFSPDPGGGFQDGLDRFVRSFDGPGVVTVQVEVCDASARCATDTVQITVVRQPTPVPLRASITVNGEVRAGATMQFLGAAEGNPDGWRWSFESANPTSSGLQSPYVTFNSPGQKAVSLTVTRGDERVQVTRTINVLPPSAVPLPFEVACAPITAEQGETSVCRVLDYSPANVRDLRWTASATGSDSLSSRDLGNGRFELNYRGAGTVRVRATAVDIGTGTSVADTAEVTYTRKQERKPKVQISGPGQLESNQTGSFSATNDGGEITSYRWSANGTTLTGSGRTFSASWAVAGTYEITLDVSGPGGSSSDTHQVTIRTPDPGETGTAIKISDFRLTSSGSTVTATYTTDACATSVFEIAAIDYKVPRTTTCSTSHRGTFNNLIVGETYTVSTAAFPIDNSRKVGFANGLVTVGTGTPGGGGGGPGDGPVAITGGPSIGIRTNTAFEVRLTTNVCSAVLFENLTTGEQDAMAGWPNVVDGQCTTSHSNPVGLARYGWKPLKPGSTHQVRVTVKSADGTTASAVVTGSTTGGSGPEVPVISINGPTSGVLDSHVVYTVANTGGPINTYNWTTGGLHLENDWFDPEARIWFYEVGTHTLTLTVNKGTATEAAKTIVVTVNPAPTTTTTAPTTTTTTASTTTTTRPTTTTTTTSTTSSSTPTTSSSTTTTRPTTTSSSTTSSTSSIPGSTGSQTTGSSTTGSGTGGGPTTLPR